MNDATSRPLAGIRVIELARVLAGPWAGQVLADLGADVVKVESPTGDDTRGWGPPFVEYTDGGRDAAYFHSCNHGKRSVVADFRTAAGAGLATRLCLDADVVIENFKHGGLQRFGLDAVTLRTRNPRLIYCSITGFGQGGPLANLPGYDLIVQAMSGYMDITGEPDGPPMKSGVAIADLFTGLHAVIAVEAALLRRARTGEGATIDLALLDTQVSMLANQALNFLVSGSPPHRIGNANPNIVPYQLFRVSDGDLLIAVGNDGQFQRLVQVLGEPQLAEDPGMRTNADRVRNRERVVAAVQAACLRFTRAGLASALNVAGVPVGPVRNVAEAFAEPQVRARDLQLTVRSRDGEAVPAVRTPIRIDGQPAPVYRAAPRLGEHQREVEAELAARGGAGDSLANPPK